MFSDMSAGIICLLWEVEQVENKISEPKRKKSDSEMQDAQLAGF